MARPAPAVRPGRKVGAGIRQAENSGPCGGAFPHYSRKGLSRKGLPELNLLLVTVSSITFRRGNHDMGRRHYGSRIRLGCS